VFCPTGSTRDCSPEGAKRNPGPCIGGTNPGLRFAPSGLQDLALPVGQNTQTTGQSFRAKIFPFTEIRLWRIQSPPHPCQRGVSRSSRNAGWAAVDASHIGAKGFAGRETVSEGVAHTTGVARVRQNRVVLTPGVCASSLVVMWAARPGIRISHPQGDGGNSASLPGESSA
jgi:hypothetical protein